MASTLFDKLINRSVVKSDVFEKWPSSVFPVSWRLFIYASFVSCLQALVVSSLAVFWCWDVSKAEGVIIILIAGYTFLWTNLARLSHFQFWNSIFQAWKQASCSIIFFCWERNITISCFNTVDVCGVKWHWLKYFPFFAEKQKLGE